VKHAPPVVTRSGTAGLPSAVRRATRYNAGTCGWPRFWPQNPVDRSTTTSGKRRRKSPWGMGWETPI